jgi:hypothetical protein
LLVKKHAKKDERVVLAEDISTLGKKQ